MLRCSHMVLACCASKSVQNADMYLAQNFFGVGEKLRALFNNHAHAHIVPPICPKPINSFKEHVLINLADCKIPLINVVEYAKTIVTTLKEVIPANEKIIIVGSESVAQKMSDEKHDNTRTS